MWSIAGTSKLLPVLKRRLRQRRLYFGSPRAPIFQCCLQVVTANLLSHVRKTTLTFGGAGMGLQLCNFCPVSASLTNRRVAPSAESNPQQGLDLGSFFHAEKGAASAVRQNEEWVN